MDIIETLASELGVDARQVRAVVELIDAGNTIPFVARYRKEVTGGLDDVALRALEERLAYLRNLEARKAEVLRAIDGQGKLTPELRRQITEATVMRRVEDLYKPFRKKRTTRASKARDAGLGPLAELVLSQAAGASSALEAAASYANAAGGYATPEEALAGACDIAAEAIAEDPESVEDLRGFTAREGLLVTEAVDEGAKTPYEQYYGHSEPARSMPNHRVLAANRGEREGKLRVRLDVDKDVAVARLGRHVPRRRGVFADALDAAVADGYKRLMAPSLERELRGELTKRAQQDAIRVFAKNLEFLLSQRPVRGGARVIAIDPGFRTGCKVAVLDEFGGLLDHTTIYPTPPRSDVAGSRRELTRLASRHATNTVVIGNGTASRETEEVVAGWISEYGHGLRYTIVNEAGASVYSASELASKEYPDLDVTTRGAMSLGRRLQDPLAELVKIPPQSIGVG